MSKNKNQNHISNIISSVFENSPTTGLSIISGSTKEISFEKSFGVIHSSSEVKVSSESLFDIQSITKVIATTSLLEKFISEGKLRLSDSIQEYLPEIKGPHKSKISIKDLVLHQSGMSDEDFCGTFNTTQDLWSAMFKTAVRFEPGTTIEYSDVGYRLLGLCLERIGGENLNQLCTKHLWIPLCMTQTTYDISKINLTKVAGHGESWGTVDDAQDKFLGGTLGCDSVFSTSKDMTMFAKYLLEKLGNEQYFHNFVNLNAGQLDENWSYYESLGLGKKIYGWESHHINQSYLGSSKSYFSIEKAGGAGAFICLRPEKQDFFISNEPWETKSIFYGILE